MKRERVLTADGSHTLFVAELDEHYHSVHGAVQESLHVFIHAGLKAVPEEEKNLRILEIGLGTGLNALLTLMHQGDKTIDYTGIEAYPVSPEEAESLHYHDALKAPAYTNAFQQLHILPWGTPQQWSNGFTLTKLQSRIEDLPVSGPFHLVYYDAFAPSAQPELWTEELFRKVAGVMPPGGILVTYCCKGTVRRAMQAAGLTVEKLPGPPGKREMVRAVKGSGIR